MDVERTVSTLRNHTLKVRGVKSISFMQNDKHCIKDLPIGPGRGLRVRMEGRGR